MDGRGEIDINDVQTEQVEIFLAGTGSLSGYWRRKYDLLRGLYRYAISRDLVADAPLPKTAPRLPQRFLPYIYTEDELRRIFSAAISCRKDPRKLEPNTLRAILVLLYGAGLRISEAVALTVADVDSRSAVITIRNTKFHKTRNPFREGRSLRQISQGGQQIAGGRLPELLLTDSSSIIPPRDNAR